MRSGPEDAGPSSRVAWLLYIAFVSATLGMLVSWRAPGLDLYARDWLMRTRGLLPPPNDIVIVAIDEASIVRYGRFPWPRSVIARAVGVVASAHPKAIAVDVLFSEATSSSEDSALADSIARAGNVVSAAQLARTASGEVVWLRSIPTIERASAGIGHVNVSTELEGVARELLAQEADDEGTAFWAMPIEAIRVGDGASRESVREIAGAIRVGSHAVPVRSQAGTVPIESAEPDKVRRLAAQRMTLDYVGPPGSFAPYTFSVADLLDGRVKTGQLQGKYVLIGATAASLGDRVASPFIHMDGTGGQQHGSLMPGVEVLANSINTILRSRFYSSLPDWLAFLVAAMVALITSGALSIEHTRHQTVDQVFILAALAAAFLATGYFLFTRWLVVPPLIPALVSFVAAAPLALVRRSMIASAGLDERIRELARAEAWLWPSNAPQRASPATLIARLTGASGVAIFSRDRSSKVGYSLSASAGANVVSSVAKGERRVMARVRPDDGDSGTLPPVLSPSLYFLYPELGGVDFSQVARKFRLGSPSSPVGTLVLAHADQVTPAADTLRLCVELATSFASQAARENASDEAPIRSALWNRLPKGVEWKARTLGILNRRLLARARHVDRAMRSVDDGLMVGGLDGSIIFVNRRAAEILGILERTLLGSGLLERLGEKGDTAKDTLVRLFNERVPVEREITIGNNPKRHYNLRLSPVLDDSHEPAAVIGIVASLSDITKQYELQQMKTDVMALVTHELRTPLTAIQGISEVLTQFEVDPNRRREMHAAIHDEAKRLARMIDEYLDITKLESGVRALRLAPLHMATLVDRTLLLLDPIADQRGVKIVRRFSGELPPVLVDADLLARALTNLVANAIKYSPPKTEVTVAVRSESEMVYVEVADCGCGIPHEHMGRIFEKFYRVPRVEDAETPGTGLGLAMVREIMEAHGGAVTVKSAPGTGSTFTLRLPSTPASDSREGVNYG
jgi:PAS domain S-box-containing protein